MLDWLKVIVGVLQNFPSLVLDARDFTVKGSETKKRKAFHNTVSGDFTITVECKNKTVQDKNFKIITFITDL